MENYEQKYKEALKIASNWHKDGIGDVKIIIECIFPELRESEDERIRKEIISFMTDSLNWFPKKETKASWIAWLEKQAKQKTTWSEEDVKILSKIQDHLREFYTDKKGYAYIAAPDSPEMIEFDWLKTLKDRFQPQPKQEWSEEDEYQINTILHGLDLKRKLYKKEGNKVEEDRYNTQYNWLKSLKDRVQLQPKQGWSKKDQEMIDSIINDTAQGVVLDDEQIQWIKSIKPNHWQPRVQGDEWVNMVDDACDKRYNEEYRHGEYCHKPSFKWGFQEGVLFTEERLAEN